MRNYVTSTNPFGLTPPPRWFLQELHKFDADLVLFPSMKHPVYRLARRCRKSQGVKPADVPGVENHPDTVFMCNRKLVPVTTVVPKAYWSTGILESLAARDIWRHGGAHKVVATLEDAELRQAELTRRAHLDQGDAIGSDAYASFKYRTGQRVSMAHTGAANNKKARPQYYLPATPATGSRILIASS